MHSQLAFRYTAQRSIRFCFKRNFCHVLILSIEIQKREEKMEDRRLVNSFHSHTPSLSWSSVETFFGLLPVTIFILTVLVMGREKKNKIRKKFRQEEILEHEEKHVRFSDALPLILLQLFLFMFNRNDPFSFYPQGTRVRAMCGLTVSSIPWRVWAVFLTEYIVLTSQHPALTLFFAWINHWRGQYTSSLPALARIRRGSVF